MTAQTATRMARGKMYVRNTHHVRRCQSRLRSLLDLWFLHTLLCMHAFKPVITIIIFYPSKKSVFDNKKAIRGGIPVVFRKFTLHQRRLDKIT